MNARQRIYRKPPEGYEQSNAALRNIYGTRKIRGAGNNDFADNDTMANLTPRNMGGGTSDKDWASLFPNSPTGRRYNESLIPTATSATPPIETPSLATPPATQDALTSSLYGRPLDDPFAAKPDYLSMTMDRVSQRRRSAMNFGRTPMTQKMLSNSLGYTPLI